MTSSAGARLLFGGKHQLRGPPALVSLSLEFVDNVSECVVRHADLYNVLPHVGPLAADFEDADSDDGLSDVDSDATAPPPMSDALSEVFL